MGRKAARFSHATVRESETEPEQVSVKERGADAQSLVLRPPNHLTISQARCAFPSQKVMEPALFSEWPRPFFWECSSRTRAKRFTRGHVVPLFIPKGVQLNHAQGQFLNSLRVMDSPVLSLIVPNSQEKCPLALKGYHSNSLKGCFVLKKVNQMPLMTVRWEAIRLHLYIGANKYNDS